MLTSGFGPRVTYVEDNGLTTWFARMIDLFRRRPINPVVIIKAARPATTLGTLATMIRQRRNLLFAAGTLFLVLGLALFLTRGAGTPGDASADAGFARDMGVHHAQAVEMSFIIRDATDDPKIRTLGYDIIVTQSAQRGMFMGWLQQWGLDQATGQRPMAWMAGHSHGGAQGRRTAEPAGITLVDGAPDLSSVMPGMASPQELERLKAAKGREAEILFLQLMIRHHEGGVDMARAAMQLANRPEVRTAAKHMVDSQNSEIALMTELLKERGAEPLPSILRENQGPAAGRETGGGS